MLGEVRIQACRSIGPNVLTKFHFTNNMDTDFTNNFLSTIGENVNPRAKQVFAGLIRHLHMWAQEERLHTDEMMLGIVAVSESHTHPASTYVC